MTTVRGTAGDEANGLTIVAAGDVEWSGTWIDETPEEIFLDPGTQVRAQGGWQPIPRYICAESLATLRERSPDVVQRYELAKDTERRTKERESGVTPERVQAMWGGRKTHELSFRSNLEWAQYPFLKLRSLFRAADVGFVNLETPLTDEAPRTGAFATRTPFADGLKDAGIDVVSLANNHMLDAQLWGLYDTLASLRKAGVHAVGAGRNLTEARQPYIVEKRGMRVAFLAYTQSENSGAGGFALPSRPGVAPLDPLLIEKDVREVKAQVDHVILSFHWDLFQFDATRSFDLHPEAIRFAHHMIDIGAGAILGHHAHVPRAVEYYKGRPILYSMGHLIFSYSVPAWVDNYVARLVCTKHDIPRVEILPVAGRLEELAQPYPLVGQRATEVLSHLQELSKGLGGVLTIENDMGVLCA